jgi:hypothetical protein
MRTFNILCVCVCLSGTLAQAAERPTLINTRDPRPDILPRPFYDNHTEYRAQYNRPRFFSGWLAYEVSRTSQEAMVWRENYCAGNYDQHHMPAVCKRYDYPKPWEALDVGARPDFASAKPITQRVPGLTESKEGDETSKGVQAVEERLDVQESVPPNTEVVPSPSANVPGKPTSTKVRMQAPRTSLRKSS